MSDLNIEDRILEFLDDIVARIEGPAEYVFGLAVRQQYVEFAIAASIFVVTTTLAGVIARACLRNLKALYVKERFHSYEADDEWFMLVIAGIIFLIGFVILLVNVGKVLNPELYALRDIAAMVTGG